MSLWTVLERYILKPVLTVVVKIPGAILRAIMNELLTGEKPDLPDWWPDMARNHKYPHLLPTDIVVWEKFLALYNESFDYFDYDIRVGEGRPAPGLPTAGLVKMATDLSMRRIDALGHTENVRTVIEITHTLGLKAIGQIQAYPKLYKTKYPGDYELRSLIVADKIESDMIEALVELQIPFWTPTHSNLLKTTIV